MADINLTQEDADALVAMEKHKADDTVYEYGAPHRNPDDEEIPCPHLHLYREGYGDSLGDAAPRRAVFRRWRSVAPAVRVHAVCERHRAAGHPTRLFT
ncbi:MAG TPA: hypothetical protein VH701_06920 [Vicinamibacterales bacterium]